MFGVLCSWCVMAAVSSSTAPFAKPTHTIHAPHMTIALLLCMVAMRFFEATAAAGLDRAYNEMVVLSTTFSTDSATLTVNTPDCGTNALAPVSQMEMSRFVTAKETGVLSPDLMNTWKQKTKQRNKTKQNAGVMNA